MDDSPLLLMPTELIQRTFCLLPSFSDAFAFAQASQKLQCIWTENTTSIYNSIAPRNLSCEQHARAFLADQGGPKVGDSLSANDIYCLVRNSCKVEKAILQFEKEIVSKVKRKFFKSQK